MIMKIYNSVSNSFYKYVFNSYALLIEENIVLNICRSVVDNSGVDGLYV
jgi:hypothetical protein